MMNPGQSVSDMCEMKVNWCKHGIRETAGRVGAKSKHDGVDRRQSLFLKTRSNNTAKKTDHDTCFAFSKLNETVLV